MLASRQSDIAEQLLMAQGKAAFHVSSQGHEALACLGLYLSDTDFLHLHYRDRALLLARGVSLACMFESFLGTSTSHSQGRQMSAHFSDRKRKILSTVGPVGNNALQSVGLAQAIHASPDQGIVVCTIGDGSTQQGEFYEAVAEAARGPCPVLFIVENNGLAISTRTKGKTFFELSSGQQSSFFGITIEQCNGAQIDEVDRCFSCTVNRVRDSRQPAIVIFQCKRLSDHTYSDEHSRYRSQAELNDSAITGDPLRWFESRLDSESLQSIQSQINAEIQQAVVDATRQAGQFVSPAICRGFSSPSLSISADAPCRTMLEAIRKVLGRQLEADDRVYLLGQDIEDPKGDVMGITKGLSTRFPNRVVNAPLSESTIVGTCIGRAFAGQRPVGFIQFADFLPLAMNQIMSEMASISWRTCEQWQCPVILMVAYGAYKPGLGPFHSQSAEAILAHTTGIDVLIPSRADDAADLLQAAFESRRPTIFLYSKALLSDPSATTPLNDSNLSAASLIGKARRLAVGNDITLVSWGATVRLCRAAATTLEASGVAVDLWDLRSIAPWDHQSIVESACRTKKLLVVHEDNRVCGFGAEIIATVAEQVIGLQARRVVREDSLLPANYQLQLQALPDVKQILKACCELTGDELEWAFETKTNESASSILALGSGPADSDVKILDIFVQPGDKIVAGQLIALVEASKSTVDIAAPCDGVVDRVLWRAGDVVSVGDELVVLVHAMDDQAPSVNTPRPVIRKRQIRDSQSQNASKGCFKTKSLDKAELFISRPSVRLGGLAVPTASISENIPNWPTEQAIERTGVSTRYWIAEHENGVALTQQCIDELLSQRSDGIKRIGAILCSTTSPEEATPSIACQIATRLHGYGLSRSCMAYDFNAACSGYLYGLRIAYEFLAQHQGDSVLLLTSEILSTHIDRCDPMTAFIFGDGCSASLVSLERNCNDDLRLYVPEVQTIPDNQKSIRQVGSKISMDGMAVARAASMTMADIMQQMCIQHGSSPDAIDYLIPHPGSIRVLKNVGSFLGIDSAHTLSTLNETGNTSSSSIPIVLAHYWEELTDKTVGLVAFGAGYTAAASIAKPVASIR